MSLLSKFKFKFPLLKITWGGSKKPKASIPVVDAIEKIAPMKLDASKKEPEKYPPFAKVLKDKMRTRGKYAKGFPVGCVVHFTAGRPGAERTIQGGIKNGFAYWCIDTDGQLYCAHPVDEWGYHAGESAWKHLAKKLTGAVSDDLIGIEINNAGRLTEKNGKLYTWYGVEVPKERARYTPGKDNQLKGWYEKYTPEQEQTLIETILWLKKQSPWVFDLDFVLGHDEVSGPAGIGRWRKNDPGAALSMTMPEFRSHLRSCWLKESNS